MLFIAIFNWFLLYLIVFMPLVFQNHSFEVFNSQVNSSIHVYTTFVCCICNMFSYITCGVELPCFCKLWLYLYWLPDRLISALKQLVWLLLTYLNFDFLYVFNMFAYISFMSVCCCNFCIFFISFSFRLWFKHLSKVDV